MTISLELLFFIISLVFGLFGYILNKALKVSKELVTLSDRHDSFLEIFEFSKLAVDERIERLENSIGPLRDKIQDLDRGMVINSTKLDTVIKGISKIFDLLEKKADKVAV